MVEDDELLVSVLLAGGVVVLGLLGVVVLVEALASSDVLALPEAAAEVDVSVLVVLGLAGATAVEGVELISVFLLRVDLLQPVTPRESARADKVATPVSFNF